MIDIIEKYQASTFVNASDITPSPDNITNLVNMFRDKEFIINTFHELTLGNAMPLPRLRFTSPKSEWAINFGTQRIDIEKNPTDPKGNNLGDVSNFCNEVMGMFSKIFEKYNKKSNRIALVTNYVLQEMTKERTAKAYENLFKYNDFYNTHPPFEWNWRSAARTNIDINGEQESINVITSIFRIQGQLRFANEIKPLDRIQLSLDINTSPENAEFRFDLDQTGSVYRQLNDVQKKLLSEIMGFV